MSTSRLLKYLIKSLLSLHDRPFIKVFILFLRPYRTYTNQMGVYRSLKDLRRKWGVFSRRRCYHTNTQYVLHVRPKICCRKLLSFYVFNLNNMIIITAERRRHWTYIYRRASNHSLFALRTYVYSVVVVNNNNNAKKTYTIMKSFVTKKKNTFFKR